MTVNLSPDVLKLLSQVQVDDSEYNTERPNAFIQFVAPTGAGKSYGALVCATYLCEYFPIPNTKNLIRMIDTEAKRGLGYKRRSPADDSNPDRFSFSHVAVPPNNNHPLLLVGLIQQAIDDGVRCLIIDTSTSFWQGAGGALDIKEKIVANAKKKGQNINPFTAFGEIAPLMNAFNDTLLGSRAYMHVIVLTRAKMKYNLVLNEYGKKVPVPVGLRPEARADMAYKFDLICAIDSSDHSITITKSSIHFGSLDGMTFTPKADKFGIKERPRVFWDRFAGYLGSCLLGEDLYDLRDPEDVIRDIVANAKTRQIEFSVIAYEVSKRGYKAAKDMPIGELLALQEWVGNLPSRTLIHADIENVDKESVMAGLQADESADKSYTPNSVDDIDLATNEEISEDEPEDESDDEPEEISEDEPDDESEEISEDESDEEFEEEFEDDF